MFSLSTLKFMAVFGTTAILMPSVKAAYYVRPDVQRRNQPIVFHPYSEIPHVDTLPRQYTGTENYVPYTQTYPEQSNFPINSRDQVPQSPCPNIFTYARNRQGQVFGRLNIPYENTANVKVKLLWSVPTHLTNTPDMQLLLAESPEPQDPFMKFNLIYDLGGEHPRITGVEVSTEQGTRTYCNAPTPEFGSWRMSWNYTDSLDFIIPTYTFLGYGTHGELAIKWKSLRVASDQSPEEPLGQRYEELPVIDI